MSQIDWSKAPEGATHFGAENDFYFSAWYKVEGDQILAYTEDGSMWQESRDSCVFPKVSSLSARPEQWNGEGLPPAGAVCEIRNVEASTAWAEATIIFASRNVVTWDWSGEPSINGLCTAYAHAVEIRPVRTADQLAAEEREQAIKLMISDTHILAGTMGNRRLMAEQLYDAGYRKQEAS